MGCGITDGIGVVCEDLRRVGGVRKTAYLANLTDIDGYTIDSNGYITGISFDAAYLGLYKFESTKQSHSGGYTIQIQSPGGNKFYQQDVILKMFSSSPADDQIMEQLLVSDVVVILETNNGEFILYGKDNGLSLSAGSQNTGQADASDIADTITLTGSEKEMPKRVNAGTESATRTLLESYVV